MGDRRSRRMRPRWAADRATALPLDAEDVSGDRLVLDRLTSLGAAERPPSGKVRPLAGRIGIRSGHETARQRPRAEPEHAYVQARSGEGIEPSKRRVATPCRF